MADQRISELLAASALDGTELVPIVQGGVTKRTTIEDIVTFGAPLELTAAAGSYTLTGTAATLTSADPSNLLLFPNDFDNAAWSKATVTVTANAATAPDGALTADKLEATGVDSNVRQSVTVTNATSYTWSVWLKADIATSLDLYVVCSSAFNQPCSVTTSWQQFSLVFTSDATTASCRIGSGSTFVTGEIVYASKGRLVLT